MRVAVIGAGSWGTALAQVLAAKGENVRIWARRPEVVAGINRDHANPRYLSDCRLSENVVASISHADCVTGADAVVVVTPSNLMRGVARALDGLVDPSTPILVCSKGIEASSGLLPLEVFDSELGAPERLAVLSGPNHAEEVIRALPTGTVIASSDAGTAAFFRDLFCTPSLRVYVSDDVIGVEVCAAAKNIVAIAVGAAYGIGCGDNTCAMLMTRGLAEMSRLAYALGGKPLTCMGLAGMGDLIATCTSPHSRNRTFGEALAKGESLEEYRERTHMVVEGALACRTVLPLAERVGADLPIARVVRSIVWEGSDVRAIAAELSQRPLREEFYGLG